jgi:hypothetical protein
MDTTGMPWRFSISWIADSSAAPRSILSSEITTPTGVAPRDEITSSDARTAVPAVSTSSTMSTRPASGAPMRSPPSP